MVVLSHLEFVFYPGMHGKELIQEKLQTESLLLINKIDTRNA